MGHASIMFIIILSNFFLISIASSAIFLKRNRLLKKTISNKNSKWPGSNENGQTVISTTENKQSVNEREESKISR